MKLKPGKVLFNCS